MKYFLLASLAVTAFAAPQTNFGKKNVINERLGLLANTLGLNPTAESSQSAALTAETSVGTSGQLPSGRVPSGGEIGVEIEAETIGETQCCCVPESEQCDDPFAGEDLVGLGLIDPRKKPKTINTRIVNRPGSGSSQLNTCPIGQKACCYDAEIDLSVFGRTCINPQQAAQSIPWVQGCQEPPVQGAKQCGTRNYAGPVAEYDASGFNTPEVQRHEEYTVTRILKHPQMSNTRLSNDLAILYVDRDINLNHPYVNTACLPSCDNQFDYQFSNGTGVRCYVAGWGKDEFDGSLL